MRLPLARRATNVCAATLPGGGSAAAAMPARNPRRAVQHAADELARLAAGASGRRDAVAVMVASFPAFRLAPVSVACCSIIHATHAATGHGRHGCLLLRALAHHHLT